MANLVSSVPATFSSLLSLIQEAGDTQSPAVPVFGFALAQAEPASYVLLNGVENHNYMPETLGNFGQQETYDITGIASVFSGSASPDDPTVTTDVMTETYALFEAVVMAPVVTNRLTIAPGGIGQPWRVLPGPVRYSSGPGIVGGGTGGWAGLIEFTFHFAAQIFPS